MIARRVGASGRTSAYVQGRSASVADLKLLGTRLLAFFGQHEHRRLTLGSAQLDILDGFAGAEHLELREAYRTRTARCATPSGSSPTWPTARAPASGTST